MSITFEQALQTLQRPQTLNHAPHPQPCAGAEVGEGASLDGGTPRSSRGERAEKRSKGEKEKKDKRKKERKRDRRCAGFGSRYYICCATMQMWLSCMCHVGVCVIRQYWTLSCFCTGFRLYMLIVMQFTCCAECEACPGRSFAPSLRPLNSAGQD